MVKTLHDAELWLGKNMVNAWIESINVMSLAVDQLSRLEWGCEYRMSWRKYLQFLSAIF